MPKFALSVNGRLAFALCFFILAGCGFSIGDSPQATPTVDMNHARRTFQSGGELTYEEIVAFKADTVGPTPDILAFQDTRDYVSTREEHNTRTEAFGEMLGKCRLKESIGWIAGWRYEHTPDFFNLSDVYSRDVTDHPTYRVSVQLGGQSKEVSNYATGPRRLMILQARIDVIVNSDQWVRCGEISCPE